LSLQLDRRRRVWLGAAGTTTAFGILKSIREVWGDKVTVVAADTNPAHLVAASALSDAFEQVPPAADPCFRSYLVNALKRHGIDTVVPILDEEIVLVASLREDGTLLDGTFVTLAPSSATAKVCLDKLATYHWLVSNGFPTPKTCLPKEAAWRPDGWLMKPRTGHGSIGVVDVRSENVFRQVSADGSEMIVQERCQPPECTLDAFISRRDSYSRVLCRERLEVKAGVCSKARIFEDPSLASLATRVGRGLNLLGTFCVQVMRSPSSDEWLITDVNPRPGGGTRMCAAVGVDFLAATLADAWGLDVGPLLSKLVGERFVTRQYEEYPRPN
jgi:carbamoylphosphate synthase large subunit